MFCQSKHHEERYAVLNTNMPSGWGSGFAVLPFSRAKFGEACSIEEYAFLFGFAALLRPKRILEIGTSKGLGAISIGLGVSMSGTACEVVTIDRNEADFHENLKLFPDISIHINNIQGDSQEVLHKLQIKDEKFDLCFLDGGHDYQTVCTDWQYAKNLASQWLFHDSVTEPGVAMLLDQIRASSEYQIFDLQYPPGHQLDEPTEEWYQTLKAPGFCLIQSYPQKNEDI